MHGRSNIIEYGASRSRHRSEAGALAGLALLTLLALLAALRLGWARGGSCQQLRRGGWGGAFAVVGDCDGCGGVSPGEGGHESCETGAEEDDVGQLNHFDCLMVVVVVGRPVESLCGGVEMVV